MIGIGGAYFSIAMNPYWVDFITAGRGWIAVALVIFALWHPLKAMAGAYLFGLALALELRLQTLGLNVSPYLLKYTGAMSLLAISFLLMNYLLSLNQTKVAYPLMVAVLAQIGLIIAFHSSISEIVNIMLISGALSVVLMLPLYVKIRIGRLGFT